MNDEDKILELINKYKNAIQNQDKKEFFDIWSCDEDNILISITKKFKGIDSIYQNFLIDTIRFNYSKINLIAENIEIHFISSTLASVVFEYHTECIKRIDGEKYGIKGIETQIVIKKDNEWKLVHVHYSK